MRPEQRRRTSLRRTIAIRSISVRIWRRKHSAKSTCFYSLGFDDLHIPFVIVSIPNPVSTDLLITVKVGYARPNGQHQDKALASPANAYHAPPRPGLFVPASGTHGEAGI